jgi:hypothetical protein
VTPAARPTRKATTGEVPALEPIVVTDDNVEELKKKFDTLPKNHPQYDRLGEALHRYMIG